MQEVDLVIKNGKVVSPDAVIEASIAIKGQKIVAITQEPLLPPAKEVIDAGGKFILPGVIEPHSHLNQGPDMLVDAVECEWGNFVTETRSAAIGGVTTIMTLLFRDGSPPCSLHSSTKRKRHMKKGVISMPPLTI